VDFFLSHRIYVTRDQRKIFFTYNGGPVFDLQPVKDTEAVDLRAKEPALNLPRLDNAAAYRRRAAASLERKNVSAAMADLNQAVDLDPSDAESFFQRALIYWQVREKSLAEQDLDTVLQLKPDSRDALVDRGQLRLQRGDKSGGLLDLDSLTKLAPNDATRLFQIASVLQMEEVFDEAIERFNLWIAAYPKDARLPSALNQRCWSRAMLNRELDLAMTDCNMALKKSSQNPQYLDSRGVLFLRLGQYDKSIADYDASLKKRPHNEWSLYGRGLSKLAKGLRLEGTRDIEAALAVNPLVAESFKRANLVPSN
jgi:tetratricopeptide (TPR) repeat protein